ncbi:hypothetical protein [Flavobacterium sp.]|uniref:hypothetical protein n=1 Tax=Flavobacterium sp. TaxID=239 RepID=UPI0008C09A09|nr:hypothetical protein [Flavobacterium sp.]OGS63432.1 MAG: hypothetical protein A2X07_05395 [Flavobacteria bacterium GWF1_32_7]HBD27225.1 hypothetical protein [Flavobacterium sp.]
MKRITILILLTCFSVFGQTDQIDTIKFDGIYETTCRYEKDDAEGYQSFLRFYSNGKVISVTTDCDGPTSDLKDWFNMDMEYLSVGSYETKGNKISFSTKSKNGTVNYSGRITKKGFIKLKSKSSINGYKSQEHYQFIKITGLK